MQKSGGGDRRGCERGDCICPGGVAEGDKRRELIAKGYEQNKTNRVDFAFNNVANSKNNCIFAAIKYDV